ncbi:hypothetical protein D2V17_05695 [Aurantiacibacter xanthus]|uniref:Serine kinase n=1 Tax=Aurantiacibacter xanthus TaxID=1784712 RepID=A0A3A1P9Z2_9SPHN|nr:hypothetical protein [Aurantiacibacter xanthus]RIV89758.1 hypothetical protein D2V17_05695 [Aurantiacibacter xanthus]
MFEQSGGLYDAFGLTIESDIPLNELRPAAPGAVPDIRFVNRPIGRDLPRLEDGIVMDYADPAGVVMAWPDVAAFRLVDKGTVWVEKYPDVPESYVAFPILGPIMAWMLNWREFFIIHASAIDINGKTVALMGDKLAGKSTTAAAFIRAGYPLVTDDLLAITFDDGGTPVCHPAFPQLKLAEDAAANIRVDGAEALPLVYEGFSKRQHKLAGMRTEAASLDYLVTLDRGGTAPGLFPFDTAAAIAAINRFSYMPRFADAPWTPADKARHFRACATLADKATVARLQIPDDLGRLHETVELVATALDRIEA